MLSGAFLLKWWYRTAATEELGFVLRPVAWLVAALSGEEYRHVVGEGYFFPDLRILIDRSCSGVNFMIITAATFAFLLMRRRQAGCIAPFFALASTLAAYGLTLLANSGRILAMLKLERAGIHLGPTLHEALGAFFFLVALVLTSLLLDRILHRTHHAQLA